MCLLLLLMACAIGALCLFIYYDNALVAYARTAEMIAVTVTSSIDGDAYEQLTKTFESDAYYDELKKLFDDVKTKTDSMYLYGLNNDGDGRIKYIVDGKKPDDDPAMVCSIGEQELAGTFAQETFDTLNTGVPMTTDIFDSGDYGVMLSGLSPIRNSSGQVVGVVGADISLETLMSDIWAFGFQILRIALLVTAVLAVVVVFTIHMTIGVPIKELVKVSEQVASGDLQIEMINTSHDEIGRLSQTFQEIIRSTQKQVEILMSIADSDYCGEITLRSEKDELNRSIQKMLRENIALISGIYESAHLVANGSHDLAERSATQAETLQHFSNSVAGIFRQADENNKLTIEVFQDVTKAGELTAQSMSQMQQISGAISAIQVSSDKISKVMHVIDDIAFQTNILALNAAVEAARAGQHGKGFAVVADEVRNLAQKCAQAAGETSSMIQDNVKNVVFGCKIAEAGEKGLRNVMEIAAGSARNMQKISEASQIQQAALLDMKQSVEQVSSVVQANSLTANEMNDQAAALGQLVVRFKLPNKQAAAYTSTAMSAQTDTFASATGRIQTDIFASIA